MAAQSFDLPTSGRQNTVKTAPQPLIVKYVHMYFKQNFVNNQCFHLFHLQVCFLAVPCPSVPAPQTSETDYGDDYGDYDASVKVLKDLHITTFNHHTVGS